MASKIHDYSRLNTFDFNRISQRRESPSSKDRSLVPNRALARLQVLQRHLIPPSLDGRIFSGPVTSNANARDSSGRTPLGSFQESSAPGRESG